MAIPEYGKVCIGQLSRSLLGARLDRWVFRPMVSGWLKPTKRVPEGILVIIKYGNLYRIREISNVDYKHAGGW
jgi:hypothetical protein